MWWEMQFINRMQMKPANGNNTTGPKITETYWEKCQGLKDYSGLKTVLSLNKDLTGLPEKSRIF